MRTLKTLLLMIPILLLSMNVIAECPELGVYSSIDGDVSLGRASESWVGGGEGQIGNAVLSMSWNGAALGQQWVLSCPATCSVPLLILDQVDGNGNGNQTWFTEYCGGELWLNGPGEAWDTGDASYTAVLNEASFTTTIQFAGGVPVGYVANIQFTAEFANCPEGCSAFEISNAVQLGRGLGSSFPAGYPLPVQQPDCLQDGALMGSYWDVIDLSLVITGCAVPTEDSSWSQVKSIYR